MIALKKQHREYEKCKKIPCDWLPSVPSTWEYRRAKTLIAVHSGGLWGEEPRQNEDDILCVRVADFDYEKLGITENAETIRNIEKTQRKSRELKQGDVLIEKSGGGEQQLVGRAVTYTLNHKAICSNFIERLSMNREIVPKYATYLFSAMYQGNVNLRSIKQTTGIQNLDLSSYLNEVWPLPSLNEQRAIISSLDEKCALIDHVIEGKKRQIEILQEQRTAIINRAVTKGLDENVEMKESGVEWIGEMPKNWDMKKLKTVFRFEKGKQSGLFTKEYVGDPKNMGEYPVYSGQTEDEGVMGRINSYIYNLDDTIFTTTVGAKVMTPMIIGGKFSLSQNCVLFLKQNENIDVRYFYYQLFPMFKWEKDSIPSHMQPSLRVSDLNKYSIAFPGYEEQVKIANYIEEKTKFIDEFSKEIERSISLLNEYKTSLISHVVTGEIKVS